MIEVFPGDGQVYWSEFGSELTARSDELGDLLAREEGKTLAEVTAAEFPLIGPTFSERGRYDPYFPCRSLIR
jgi:hypothetical protein